MATPPPGRLLNAVLTVQMPGLSPWTCQSAEDRSAGRRAVAGAQSPASTSSAPLPRP